MSMSALKVRKSMSIPGYGEGNPPLQSRNITAVAEPKAFWAIPSTNLKIFFPRSGPDRRGRLTGSRRVDGTRVSWGRWVSRGLGLAQDFVEGEAPRRSDLPSWRRSPGRCTCSFRRRPTSLASATAMIPTSVDVGPNSPLATFRSCIISAVKRKFLRAPPACVRARVDARVRVREEAWFAVKEPFFLRILLSP